MRSLKGEFTFLYKSWSELPNIVISEGFSLDIARKNVGNVHKTSCKVFVSHNTHCEIILSDFRIHLTIDFSKETTFLTVFGLATAHIELADQKIHVSKVRKLKIVKVEYLNFSKHQTLLPNSS